MTNQPVKPTIANPKNPIIRWIAYISSSLLLALWGSFFIEHLTMFLSPETMETLPLLNWVIQGIHLILLIGYLMVFKWPKIACIAITIGSFGLFPLTAGQNAAVYILISLIPVYLLVYLWLRERQLIKKNTPL